MRWRERALGRAGTAIGPRKFQAAGDIAAAAGVASGDRAFQRSNSAFVMSYYLRFFSLLRRRRRLQLTQHVRVEGEQHLREAERAGGAILVSVHLGDFDVAGAWLAAERGVIPVIVTAPMQPAWRDALFAGVRRRCGVVVRDTDSTGLDDLCGELAAGRFVLGMLDRRVPGPACASTLLGQPAVASLTIAALAAQTGAPIVAAATWREDDGMVCWFDEPVVVDSPSQGAAALSRAAERLGDLIRQRPDQWHIPADIGQLSWGTLPTSQAGNSPLKARRASSPACSMDQYDRAQTAPAAARAST